MREENNSYRQNNQFRLIWLFFVIIVFLLCFAAGYGLSVRVFYLSGLAAHLISGMTGLFVFIALSFLLRLCMVQHLRKNLEKPHIHKLGYSEFLKSTIDAMDQIARGDFNILIPIEEHNPFNELAESVNKMASQLSSMENLRQDFISNVSHEIQSPLTSISGFAVLLRNESLSTEQRNHYLDVIETESKRLSKLSDNLLKLSALEADDSPLKATEFKLDKQIENVVLMLEPQWAAKQLDLSLSLEKTIFMGDEGLLTQVWINLLHNAIKFTPDEGHIELCLTMDAQKVCVTISDSGMGIAKEDQIHLFERFYKVDKSRARSLGGNGLGLSLVKKIVELHGGEININSAPGEGTSFTVTLPRT